MRKKKDIFKMALGSLLGIVLFGLMFLGMSYASFAMVAGEPTELSTFSEEIVVPEILAHEDFVMPELTLVRGWNHMTDHIDDGDILMSMEEAAQIGALYIWDVFGESIDGMIVEMTYTYARWDGMVMIYDEETLSWLQKTTEERDELWWGADPEIHERMERFWDGRVFSFAIDGITGARIRISRPHFFQVELAEDPSHIVTREEARAAFDMRHHALMWNEPDPFPLYLTESEMELYLQMARTYAERHFAFTNVADVVFEQVVPIELGRDEAGEIIAIDFMLDFTATDETGQIIHLGIFWYEQRLNGLNVRENPRREHVSRESVPIETDITGLWVFVRAELADGTPWDFRYNDEIWLEITRDSVRYYWSNYWSDEIHEAVLSETDIYQFLLSDKVTIINGELDPAIRMDSSLQYNPATGLLRHYGMFFSNEGLDRLYFYFTRG